LELVLSKVLTNYLDLLIVDLIQDLLGFVLAGSVGQELRKAEGVGRPVGEELDQDASGCKING
jgi:hypothetical protein